MSEWWTYTLSDFLLFSPRVYYRLFELHNGALWPAQILTLVLGLAIFLLLLMPRHSGRAAPAAGIHDHRPGSLRRRDRLIPAILGALWMWIAWAFFWESYATINWASAYVAPFFGLQGLWLLWIGTIRGHLAFVPSGATRDVLGLALLAFCLVGYPLLAPLIGRPWLAAEIFGIAPDPTAVATLAVLALAHGRTRWLLAIIPLSWCGMTGVTLWTMEAPDFFIAPIGALAAVGIASMRSGPDQRS